MRTPSLLVVVAALLSACGYTAPSSPTPIASTPSLPATITIAATPGIGSTAGQVFLAATVRDASGRGVGSAMVHFSTTAGHMQPDTVMSDGGGQAQATVVTSSAATITATAGSARANIDVVPSTNPAPITHPVGPIDPPLPPLPPPAPGTPPVAVPPAPPAPPAPAPPASLSVSLTCTAVAHGAATPCNLSASYGGASIPSTAIVRVDWDFGDGSSQTVTGVGAAIVSHAYVQAGTYLVVAAVDAITFDGTKGTSASLSIKVP